MYNRGRGYYHLKDTDFDISIPIPYMHTVYDENGNYTIIYNQQPVPTCSWIIGRALAIILEYGNRNLNITQNLARFYISTLQEGDLETLDQVLNTINENHLWFAQYCPELAHNACINKKVRQYAWTYNLH